MADLAASFDDVADAYERGRPRYAPHVIEAIGAAAGGPRLLDVGAGTGRLAGPLTAAGYDVVAVEPLDGMHAILAATIGPQRALHGSAEALPLGDASVDGAVCSDAWHWFDGARAAAELARVVRPGGGVVICVSLIRWYEDDGGEPPPWARDVAAVIDPLRKASDHPYFAGTRRPDGLEGHPAFGPMELRRLAFAHRTDREGLVAWNASLSFVASLDPPPRAAALGKIEAALARRGVDEVEIPFRAELWITRRRPAPARPGDRPAAAS